MTQTYTDIDLSFDELVRACGGGADWVVQLIEEEVISINGSPAQARYSSLHLARIRRAGRIHRDFDASAAATALGLLPPSGMKIAWASFALAAMLEAATCTEASFGS